MTSKSTLASSPQQPSTSQPLSFHSAYSSKPRIHSITFPDQGVTKQSFKDECDINNIMRRFEATGELPLNQRPMLFGDCPDIDFQGAMAVVVDARERFQALPAEVRDRFQNDPQRLLNFLNDDSNRPEAERLGLVKPRQEQSGASQATPLQAPPSASAPAQASPASAASNT